MRKMPTAFIYTMNIPEKMVNEYQYHVHFGLNESVLARTFGSCETLCSFETLQFEDYDRIVFDYCDPEERRERHRTVFPLDCRNAFDLGKRLVQAGNVQPDQSRQH